MRCGKNTKEEDAFGHTLVGQEEERRDGHELWYGWRGCLNDDVMRRDVVTVVGLAVSQGYAVIPVTGPV